MWAFKQRWLSNNYLWVKKSAFKLFDLVVPYPSNPCFHPLLDERFHAVQWKMSSRFRYYFYFSRYIAISLSLAFVTTFTLSIYHAYYEGTISRNWCVDCGHFVWTFLSFFSLKDVASYVSFLLSLVTCLGWGSVSGQIQNQNL